MTQLRKMMLEELQRRNYSKTTVNAYLKMVESFANHFHRSPDQLGPEEIRAYQVYLFTERKLGARTVGHHTAALRFFFCKTLKRNYPIEEVPYPRASRRLPDHPDPGRSRPAYRFGEQSVSSRHADDAVFDWHAPGRTLPSQGRGHR